MQVVSRDVIWLLSHIRVISSERRYPALRAHPHLTGGQRAAFDNRIALVLPQAQTFWISNGTIRPLPLRDASLAPSRVRRGSFSAAVYFPAMTRNRQDSLDDCRGKGRLNCLLSKKIRQRPEPGPAIPGADERVAAWTDAPFVHLGAAPACAPFESRSSRAASQQSEQLEIGDVAVDHRCGDVWDVFIRADFRVPHRGTEPICGRRGPADRLFGSLVSVQQGQ